MTDAITSTPLSIAVAAMGGQGGGVLSGWIVDLAEGNGYYAQATSVPGVAQRTGATINYVEILPDTEIKSAGKRPVLSLMPTPGNVDIVIAGELAEAGRAVQRGIVTPNRTTLIASSHRSYAIGEKSAMSDGRIDSEAIIEAAKKTARAFHGFDMEALATKNETVISAVLFGALAGSGALPFPVEAYKDTIRRGGRAIDASIAGFMAGLAGIRSEDRRTAEDSGTPEGPSKREPHPKLSALLNRVKSEFPASSLGMIHEGIRRLIDYQDPEYAISYLDRLSMVRNADTRPEDKSCEEELLIEAARHLALWMSYEDTIRVADLKTRSARFARCRTEAGAEEGQIVHITEFMHPRVEEISDTLPAWLGTAMMNNSILNSLAGWMFGHAWKIRTSKLWGFLLLFTLGRMKVLRRSSYRYKREEKNISEWLQRIISAAGQDPAIALEIILCQKLVKGYGDTHERGWKNYSAIMSAIDKNGPAGTSAEQIRALRSAALADEYGNALRVELETAA